MARLEVDTYKVVLDTNNATIGTHKVRQSASHTKVIYTPFPKESSDKSSRRRSKKEEQLVPKDDDYMAAYLKYRDDFKNRDIVPEPILSEENARYTVYPTRYPTIWKMYKRQLQCNWVVEEVDLSKDVIHWENDLSDDDRHILMYILAYFAGFDGIVNVNIKKNLIDVVKIKEAECAYGKQFEMENAHGEMYSIMIDALIQDETVKQNLFEAIQTIPSIRKKAEWYRKWIDSDHPFVYKLIVSAIVEGIFFSGAFASIFWLKTRPGSVMPGLRKSNKFIARDENLHVEQAYEIHRLLNNHLRDEVVYQIMEEAVEYEDEFINEAFPCRLLGMNSQLMSQYIRYCADRLLVGFGYPKKYNVEMPFEYMKKIDTFCKENFFEGRNDAYSDASIDNQFVFKILDEF